MVFNFTEYCDTYQIPYVTERGNLSKGWMAATDCPWCGSYEKYHLGVPPDGSYTYCWACGYHSLRATIYALTPHTDIDAVLEEFGDSFMFVSRLKKTAHAEALSLDFPECNKAAIRYLTERGFDPSIIIPKYNLRFGGIFGDWAFRIITPIYQDGRLVSWQGRHIKNDGVGKYKFLSIEKSVVDPKDCLWNIDNCKKPYILTTEGTYDGMKLGDDTCAVMGITTTEAQARRLAGYKKVFLVYDPEEEAQKRARDFAAKISSMSSTEVEVIDTEEDYDLGATSFEEIAEIRRELGV